MEAVMQTIIDRGCGIRDRFLHAVHPRQRAAVAALLREPRNGGLGLRMWLRGLEARGGELPDALPPGLVRVYLDDPDAVPLHDCGRCGLAIPIHPGPLGYEDEPTH